MENIIYSKANRLNVIISFKGYILHVGLIELPITSVTALSQHGKHRALYLIDKNTNTFYSSSTLPAKNEWVQMGLAKSGTIFWIKIENRKDCCGERLSNIEARVGEIETTMENPSNILRNELCGTYVGPGKDGEIVYIQCTRPLKGKYVTLRRRDDKEQIINIAEVAVFGKNLSKFTN